MSDVSFPEDWTNHEPEANSGADIDPLCQEVAALIPAYSVGATDPEETALVQARLARCREAASALAAHSALNNVLLHAVKPVTPPAALEARLRRSLVPARPAPAPPVAAPAKPTAWYRQWRWSTFWVATAATAILLLVVLNIYWIDRNLALQRQYDALVALQTQQIANENAAYILLASDQRQSVELPAAQEHSYANAEVLWDPELKIAMLYANRFPPLPTDQVYQLWLVKNGERTSGGLFKVDDNGVGVLMFPISAPIDQLDALGVTAEPLGGSEGPTSPAVVRRRFNES